VKSPAASNLTACSSRRWKKAPLAACSAILSCGRLDQLRQAVLAVLSALRPEPGDHPVDKRYHAAFVAAGLVPGIAP
jgi:hypothetical protein